MQGHVGLHTLDAETAQLRLPAPSDPIVAHLCRDTGLEAHLARALAYAEEHLVDDADGPGH